MSRQLCEGVQKLEEEEEEEEEEGFGRFLFVEKNPTLLLVLFTGEQCMSEQMCEGGKVPKSSKKKKKKKNLGKLSF